MKQTHDRQNKRVQLKPTSQAPKSQRDFSHPADSVYDPSLAAGTPLRRGGSVCGLVADMLVATKIAQVAQRCHFSVHHYDSAARLLEHCRQAIPSVIVIDWDKREAEAFKMLKELSSNADFKGVGMVGFATAHKGTLGEEARRAGCERIYTRTEFMRDLENILTRYAK